VHHRFRMNQWSVVCVFLLSICLLGCGDTTGNRISGKVTFAGKPVPAGKIYFRPDSSKGSSGSTGYADIRDGQYDTSIEGGQGAPAGAVVIMIEGNDPTAASSGGEASADITTKPLFSGYETTAELPKGASTKDIEVPAEAAKGPVAPKVNKQIVP
jgi:hypothetical protein